MLRAVRISMVLTLFGLLAACGDEATGPNKSGAVMADEGLVDGAVLGAADAVGPYRGAIGWDRAVEGRLDAGTWYHYYSIDIEAGSSATIEATGQSGTDTYLMLYRYQGRQWRRVAANDDCRRGTYDSCLDRQLTPGSYLVLVSTYDALALGELPDAAYTLRVVCRRGACAELLCGTNGRRDVPTEFVSAEEPTPRLFDPIFRTLGTDAEETSSEPTVEEGDIYRVLEGGRILNLNAYRGLQVIDVRDPADPHLLSRLQVSGDPVELYVLDGVAYVLLNNWQGYYGSRDDVKVESYQGGLLVSVDLSDPARPAVIDRVQVPGWIRTSRLVHDGERGAIYIAADESAQLEEVGGLVRWETRTVATSFRVRSGEVEPVDRIDVGGSVAQVQATASALLVAVTDWRASPVHSRVTVIDTSDVTGEMAELDGVDVRGVVNDQFNLDLRDGILRVVSGSPWNGTTTNHLETFDLTGGAVAPADHCEFGEGQSLFATLFLEDRAFFVTYLRVDPFHAFAIGADGSCQEMSEFAVSGWNEYFRAVAEGRRLVGIGVDDTEGSRAVSVSLYDITNLNNSNPLVARANVAAESSWSEALWDHRAISVLENVVSVQSDGVDEAGLILIPFTGYNNDWSSYMAGVQIFTFSETTLTRRGVMLDESVVRRSFPINEGVTSNLSDVSLSVFDNRDPDAPKELGRVELAPNYTEIEPFGDYAVRLNRTSDYYSWWGPQAERANDRAEVVPFAGNLDGAAPAAEIQVPGGAQIERVGHSLVVVDQRYEEGAGTTGYRTGIEVFDLTDPTAPSPVGAAETVEIPASGGFINPLIRCIRWPCFGPSTSRYVAGDALVFVEPRPQQETVGTEHVCTTSPVQPVCDEEDASCPSYRGAVSCTQLDEGAPVCTGEISACRQVGSSLDCQPVDPAHIETREDCYSSSRERYWQSYRLHILDLSDPAAPTFVEPLELPLDEEGVNVLVDGARLWIGVKQPDRVDDSGQPSVRYYARAVDLSTPSEPVLGEAVNVPGRLFAVDGAAVLTQDPVFGEHGIEARIGRSVVCDGLAYLQATAPFQGQDVATVVLDGHQVLVSHSLTWQLRDELGVTETAQRLTLLDAETLERLGDTEIDTWASLRVAQQGRALFEVPGGVMLFNTEGATPEAQAYFPVRGWPQAFHLIDGRIIFAAGRYGVYDLSMDVANLL